MTNGKAAITLASEGGFAALPGVAREKRLEREELEPDELTRIERLIASTRFLDRAEPAPPDPEIRDGVVHILTIVDGERQRTMRLTHSERDAGLVELLNAVRKAFRDRGHPVM